MNKRVTKAVNKKYKFDSSSDFHRVAIRTAFIARFIVLREGRRSKAHRIIEELTWESSASANEIALKIREAFIENGDQLFPVDRDINRAFVHAERSGKYFVDHYLERATLTFKDALIDYAKSNMMLFGEKEFEGEKKNDPTIPKKGGWRIPKN